MAMVVEEAATFASNYEFQLVAGTFHEDIDDFAAATKCKRARIVTVCDLTARQILLRVREAKS